MSSRTGHLALMHDNDQDQDPRVPALAERMELLVEQMHLDRAELGTISDETASAFRTSEAAYWHLVEEPDVPLSGIERDQAEIALREHEPVSTVRHFTGSVHANDLPLDDFPVAQEMA